MLIDTKSQLAKSFRRRKKPRQVDLFRQAAANKLRANPTFTEMRAIELLKAANISYEFQRLIKRYIVDFYLPEHKVVVELDGESHDHTTRKDLLRDSWFWRYGYKVVRINNSDVEKLTEKINELIKPTEST